MQSTVSVRVLFTPEILDNIMQHSDEHARVKCMRVCRTWKDIAKDLLWKEMESTLPLFALLAPMQESDSVQTKTYVRFLYMDSRSKPFTNYELLGIFAEDKACGLGEVRLLCIFGQKAQSQDAHSRCAL